MRSILNITLRISKPWRERPHVAGLVAFICLSGVACAPMQTVKSDQATTYQGMVALGEHARGIKPDANQVGKFEVIVVESVQVLPATAAAHPKVAEEVKATLDTELRKQLQRRFPRADGAAVSKRLVVRTRITSIAEASPGLNIAMSLLVGPVSQGGLSIEVEAIDASTGKQVALLLLADKASISDFKKSYTRGGHAQLVAGRFAVEAADFLAPLGRAVP